MKEIIFVDDLILHQGYQKHVPNLAPKLSYPCYVFVQLPQNNPEPPAPSHAYTFLDPKQFTLDSDIFIACNVATSFFKNCVV